MVWRSSGPESYRVAILSLIVIFSLWGLAILTKLNVAKGERDVQLNESRGSGIQLIGEISVH